jgi:hypothetical protein
VLNNNDKGIMNDAAFSADILSAPLAFCGRNPNQFPCDASAIVAVSTGIATGACALIFVYFLYVQVRKRENFVLDHVVAS